MKKYDVIVIGLGPAGMAVVNMAVEMELKVLAVDRRKIGGEYSKIGDVSSSALLEISEKNPLLAEPFARINSDINHLRDNTIMSLAEKVDLLMGVGTASFVDGETIEVAGEKYCGKHIFIAAGTTPFIPPILGLDKVDYLTNQTLFHLQEIPESMTFIGGGSIGCQLAQAFARVGCRCTIVHDRPHLLPNAEKEAGELVRQGCEKLGITVYDSHIITYVSKNKDGSIVVHTREGVQITSEKLMVVTGRLYDYSSLHLENAGIEYGRKGIIVDDYLRTTNKNIRAIGDCNGSYLLADASAHQGVLALTNSLLPQPLRKKYQKEPAPWTVFTEPQVSHVGRTREQLEAAGTRFQAIEVPYGSRGALKKGKATGYVRVYTSPTGRIYGVGVVGAGSDSMINEWAHAMQHNIGLPDLMMTASSFPMISKVSKQIGKQWMETKVKPGLVNKLQRFLF